MTDFNICLCGAQASFPHAIDCPRPCFTNAQSVIDEWERDREVYRKKFNVQLQGQKLLASLTWKVEFVTHAGDCEIMSRPEIKTHKITLPEPDYPDPPRPTEYLHELCHAKLAETVHPLLSGIYFKKGTNPDFVEFYTSLFRCVNDWFADGILMSLCPEEELKEIEEHVDLIMHSTEHLHNGQLDTFFGAAVILAEFIYYGKAELNLGGMILHAVDAFLKTDPHKPSIEAVRELLNSLLEIINAKYRMKLVIDDGVEAWQFVG